MQKPLPSPLNVLIATPRATSGLEERIRAVAPGNIEVANIWDDLYAELKAEWSERMMERLAGPPPVKLARSPVETAALLRSAHVMLCGMPFPMHLKGRTPQLMWAHFGFAGISNLRGSDFWAAPFTVTSGRGFSGAKPIADSVIAAAMMFARRLDVAVRNTNASFDPTMTPAVMGIEGKTMGIVGLGGIGRNVARLARGLGMRVIATRHSAAEMQRDVDGVDELYPARDVATVVGQSDFIALCAMWTAETEGMFDDALFAAVKPGAFFMNVSRGELVKEDALVTALEAGHLGGAYLDVWEDDMGRLPDPRLLVLPNVVITPHISQMAEVNHNYGIEVFLENLQRLASGNEPLINVVDWRRGY